CGAVCRVGHVADAKTDVAAAGTGSRCVGGGAGIGGEHGQPHVRRPRAVDSVQRRAYRGKLRLPLVAAVVRPMLRGTTPVRAVVDKEDDIGRIGRTSRSTEKNIDVV